MKHIKYFESVNQGTPKIGDYVLAHFDEYSKKIWRDYMRNNIGQIEKIEKSTQYYHIKYFLTKDIIKYHFKIEGEQSLIKKDENKLKYVLVHLHRNNILKFSPDKEELETYIINTKYNL